MHRVALNGACGRMGSRIAKVISEQHTLRLVAAIEHKDHPAQGQDYGVHVGLPQFAIPIQNRLDRPVDVLIDFTTPDSTQERLAECLRFGTPIVIGTTGHSPEQLEKISATTNKIPVLIAPNMSVGVNLIFRIAADIARLLGEGYDIEIVEAHHRFKKDAPSGTALRLAQGIADALGRDLGKSAVHGREGVRGERDPGEIGIHAIRAGDIVGEHTVIYSNLGERIELIHRAHSRDTFALGAVRAANFLASAAPGNYSIEQAFGLSPVAEPAKKNRSKHRKS